MVATGTMSTSGVMLKLLRSTASISTVWVAEVTSPNIPTQRYTARAMAMEGMVVTIR